MQKNIWLVVVVVLLLLMGIFYVLNNNQKKLVEDKTSQLNIATNKFEKLLAYENNYLGNASNTSNLFNNLPLSNDKTGIAIDSDKLTLIVNYDIPSNSEEEKAVIYNTTAAFVLIKNLEEIEMRFSSRSYLVKRDNVEKWFGHDYTKLINPETFMELVQKPLLQKNSDDWLEQYTNEGDEKSDK
ncbi:DUF4825 domain-containing protein [Psychrobacillus sp. NPDC058041]|uniref:DUF4825 domain-containing protein n=1 Tax=Psychrobacillus sp. NPDC058041 TaxID=3346310 RepID=UPI0036DDB091